MRKSRVLGLRIGRWVHMFLCEWAQHGQSLGHSDGHVRADAGGEREFWFGVRFGRSVQIIFAN